MNTEVCWWDPRITALVVNYVMGCHICNGHNPRAPYKCPVGRFPVSEAPLQDITIDFTDAGVGQVLAGDGGMVHKLEGSNTMQK